MRPTQGPDGAPQVTATANDRGLNRELSDCVEELQHDDMGLAWLQL